MRDRNVTGTIWDSAPSRFVSRVIIIIMITIMMMMIIIIIMMMMMRRRRIIIIIIIIITTTTTIMMMMIIIIIIIMIMMRMRRRMIIIIITIIAFKGAIPDFLQSPHCTANRLQHVRSSVPGANVCTSSATHRALITCNMTCYVPHSRKGQLSYEV